MTTSKQDDALNRLTMARLLRMQILQSESYCDLAAGLERLSDNMIPRKWCCAARWFMMGAMLLLFGCGTKVRVNPTLTVTCAPSVLEHDRWAVLTVLHIHDSGTPPVKVRESELAKVAVYSRTTEIYDPNPDGSGYSLQVFLIRPLNTNSITLDAKYYENVSGNIPEPVHLRMLPTP